MTLANVQLGQAAVLWIEVFVCPGELEAAQVRARAADIHTIVADQARSRVVLMVRTPARRDDDSETKLDEITQVEQIIRGTLSVEGLFPKTLREAEFETSHLKYARSAVSQPNTDAWQFELAVLSLGNQVNEVDLDLLRLYLIPLSAIQERDRHRAQHGSWTKQLLWRNWNLGDAGFEKKIRDMYDQPSPPKVWTRQ